MKKGGVLPATRARVVPAYRTMASTTDKPNGRSQTDWSVSYRLVSRRPTGRSVTDWSVSLSSARKDPHALMLSPTLTLSLSEKVRPGLTGVVSGETPEYDR